ncbi:MAG TPA: dihydrolipoyl dehydrogenase [Ktedonobacterales bacterium]|nr:dihydrolipoyl dehydrogenase [Ktedonobacterales bacterium]
MATEQNQFDVLVLGAGVGGYPAAIRAAQLGAKVAIVEKEYLGGTCLNVGCIPSKALIHVADTLRSFDLYEDFGIQTEKPKFDMRQAVTFKEKVVKQLTGGVGQLLKANGVKVFEGLGTPLSPNRVRIEGKDGKQEVTTGKLILANGSVTLKPPFPGINGERVIFSDDVLSLKEAPRSMICIGGGVIAVELACAFAAFGTKVTVIEMLPSIVATEDPEVINLLTREMKKQEIEIFVDSPVQSIEDNGKQKKVIAKTPNGEQAFTADYVLVAVGRGPNNAGLDELKKQGLAMDRARVKANERMETNLPGVYAVGDLVGKTMLAHVASTEGETAAENAMGHAATMDYNAFPRPIYTHPEIASVGLTESAAKERDPKAHAEKFPFRANSKALSMDEADGFVKVILGQYGEVLGATIIGPDATNLITEYTLAMRAELTSDEIIATIHPHPTLSEALREAVLAAEGRPIHIALRQPAARR